MNRNEDAKNSPHPENNPSKPMDSQRDVANSPDEKTDQDFPGYPHHPASEDHLDKSTGSHRVDAGVQEAGTGSNRSGVGGRYPGAEHTETPQPDASARKADDAMAAGLDGGNEEIGTPQNVSNEDLDQNNQVRDSGVDEAAEKGSTNP